MLVPWTSSLFITNQVKSVVESQWRWLVLIDNFPRVTVAKAIGHWIYLWGINVITWRREDLFIAGGTLS